MAELISRSHNQKLGLTITISRAGAEPQSPIELEAILTEHVVGCRHCLAMVLFREETLDEVGCVEYKGLLAKALAVCATLTAPLSVTDHISDDILEEYCFNRLSSNDSAHLEKHIEICLVCAKKLEQRSEFIKCVKAALALLAEHDTQEGQERLIAPIVPAIESVSMRQLDHDTVSSLDRATRPAKSKSANSA